MNERELNILKKRQSALSQVIKAQHILPKNKRNPEIIKNAQARLRIINNWMNGNTEAYAKILITKEEFRRHIEKELGLPEPNHTITVEDVETLEKVWPMVLEHNIQMRVNQNNMPLVKRFKQLVREHKTESLKKRG